MFTPQKLGWPGWSPKSAEKKEKGKVPASAEARSEAVSPVKGLIDRAMTTTTSASTLEDNGEPEIWRRFREVGALDEAAIDMKDKASFMAHLSTLESELHDYQYNMGVLLMERKDWNSKLEKMKAVLQEAEDNCRKDSALQSRKLSEFEKREESLKIALAIEKQCVSDLEKALKDMRAESAELKVSSESKLAQARDMVASTEEKALLSESKLHAADAMQAEVRRQLGVAERNLQEVEAREDALRREWLSLKSVQEAHESELNRQREVLLEWEKKLQEGQDRLLDGQKLLNHREELANRRDEGFKKVEMDLMDTKMQLEKERTTLRQLEADLGSKVSSLTVREETAIKRDINIDKREQELLLLQEKVASKDRLLDQREAHLKESEIFLAKERERLKAAERALALKEESLPEQQKDLIELQKAIDKQKQELEGMKADVKLSFEVLENEKLLLDKEKEELELKKLMFLEKQSEHDANIDALMKLQQQVDKKVEKQLEKEMDLDGKIKALKDKERALRAEEKSLGGEKKLLAQDKESAKLLLLEIQDLKASVEVQREQLVKEEERLRVTQQDREDLVKLQRCLKAEIDDCRAQAKTVASEGEALKREKERFEKEWDILDEKRDQIKKELERADEEAHRVANWLRNEETRLKEERKTLREQIQNESEALRLEKEDFSRTVERERSEWFAAVEKQREILVRDVDARKKEMESIYEKRAVELDKQRKEKDLRFKKEVEQEKEKIEGLKEMAEKKLEEVEQEKLRLNKEKQDIAKLREDCGREWYEIRKGIDELQLQREKLKEQREALIEERKETLQEAERLRKLKGEEEERDKDIQAPSVNDLPVTSPNWRHLMSPFHQEPGSITQTVSTSSPSLVQLKPDSVASDTPSRISWLRKCVSGLFQSPDGKLEPFIFRAAEKTSSPVSPKIPFANLLDSPEQGGVSKREKLQESSSTSRSTDSPRARAPSETSEGQSKRGSDHLKSYLSTADTSGTMPSLLPVYADMDLGITESPAKARPVENGGNTGGAMGFHSLNDMGKISTIREGRKRYRNSIGNATDMDDEDVEAVPEVATVGSKRKRNQGISAERVSEKSFERQSPAIKRYNFRRSTITKMGAPKSSDGLHSLEKPKDTSLLEQGAADGFDVQTADRFGDTNEIQVQEQRGELPSESVRNIMGSESLERDRVGKDVGNVNEPGDKIALGMSNGGAAATDSEDVELGRGEEDRVEAVEEGEEDKGEVVEDGEANGVEPAQYSSEEEFANEGEDNGHFVDNGVEEASEESVSEEDNDIDGEEQRTLKQKWWDYLTT